MADKTIKMTFDGDGNLVEVTKKVEGGLEKVGKEAKLTDKELKKVNNALKDTSKEAEAAANKTQKGAGAFNKLKAAAIGYISVQMAKKVVAETFELAQLGAQAQLVEKNFDKMATARGISTNQMMIDMRLATMGMVSDMELQQKSMQAMISGVNPKDMITAMEFVSKFAIATGTDVNQKMQSVFTGFARGSAQFLDDVGIQVMGSSDVVGDAVEQMKEKMGQFADSSGSATIGVKEMHVAINQMKTDIGESLIPTLQKVTTLITGWAPKVSKATTAFIKMQEVMFTSLTIADARLQNTIKYYQEEKKVSELFDLRLGLVKELKDNGAEEVRLSERLAKLKKEGFADQSGVVRVEQLRLDKLTKQNVKLQEQIKLASEALSAISGGGKKGGEVEAVTGTALTESEKKEQDKRLKQRQKHLADINSLEQQAGLQRHQIDMAIVQKKQEADNLMIELEFSKMEKQNQILESIKSNKLTEAEREIEAIKADYALKESLMEGHTQALIDLEIQKNEAIDEVRLEEKERLDAVEQEKIEVNAEKRDAVMQNSIMAAQQTANAIADAVSSRYSRESQEIDKDNAKKKKTIKESNKSEKQKNKEIKKLDEEAAKEKHELALKQWRLNMIMAVADTAIGVIKTIASVGFPAAIPLLVAQGIAAGAAIGSLAASKPKMAEGGFVPGNSISGDRVDISANSNELISTTSQQGRLLNYLEGRVPSGNTNSNSIGQINIEAPQINISGNVTEENVQQIGAIHDDFRASVVESLYEALERNEIDDTRLVIA